MSEWFLSRWQRLQEWWIGYSIPTQDTAMLLDVAMSAVAGVLILVLFLKSFESRLPALVPVALTIVVVGVTSLQLQLQRSFYGEVDRRCHLYENGALGLEFVAPPAFVRVHDSVLEPMLIVMLVKSSARWGNGIHTCGLLQNHPKTIELFSLLGDSKGTGSGGSGGGVIGLVFTFGGTTESPNVTFVPDFVPPEKGLPDVPDEQA